MGVGFESKRRMASGHDRSDPAEFVSVTGAFSSGHRSPQALVKRDFHGLADDQSCLRLFELDLPIDDNPDGTADRKQVLFFTKERRLGDETPAFAAGLPGCHHASLARTWPPFDVSRGFRARSASR
jgi:hypothetical protein